MMSNVVFLEAYTDLYRNKIDVIEENRVIDVDIRIVLHDKPHVLSSGIFSFDALIDGFLA